MITKKIKQQKRLFPKLCLGFAITWFVVGLVLIALKIMGVVCWDWIWLSLPLWLLAPLSLAFVLVPLFVLSVLYVKGLFRKED